MSAAHWMVKTPRDNHGQSAAKLPTGETVAAGEGPETRREWGGVNAQRPTTDELGSLLLKV